MTDLSFGEILQDLRKIKSMSQSDLAKQLNIHITTVKNWESSACLPDAKNLCALADLFNVTTDRLLGRDHADIITLDDLNSAERKQVIHIVQAYIDTLPRNK